MVHTNQRIAQRRKGRRVGPRQWHWTGQVRSRRDGSVILTLPGHILDSLSLGRERRIWFHFDGKQVRITTRPWGARQGRRLTARLRQARGPLEEQLQICRAARVNSDGRATRRNRASIRRWEQSG